VRERGERLREDGAPLIHERPGLREIAPQLGLDLPGDLGVHECEGKAERDRRQQRAGQEDPVRQR
jgi:hypothetical protein